LKVKKTSNRNAGIGKITIARIISRTNGTPRLPSVKLLMFFIITALSNFYHAHKPIKSKK
jgi:hypothetical protein